MHEQRSRLEYVGPMDDADPSYVATTNKAEDWAPFSSWSTEPRDLDAGRDPIELEPGHAKTAPEVTHGRDKSPEALGIDPIAIAAAEPAWAPDIKNHHRDDVLDDRQGLRVWLIGAALITAFSLGWAGGANSDRFLSIGSDTSSRTKLLNPETQTVLAKSSRLASANSTNAAPEAPKPRKFSVANAGTPEQAQKQLADAPGVAATPPNPIASLLQESATAPGPAAARGDAKATTRLTPVPETRPATIAGWTVRDVQGGQATLDGPGGVWKVATGDTVPGVGRVLSIVRWGGRWVVATSRGLIATR